MASDRKRKTLTGQHIRCFAIALCAGLMAFALVYFTGTRLAEKVLVDRQSFSREDVEYVTEFADYVKEEKVTPYDVLKLNEWVDVRDAFRMEIRDGDKLLFQYFGSNPVGALNNVKPSWMSGPYSVEFADGVYSVYLWRKSHTGIYMFIIVTGIFAACGVFIAASLAGIQGRISYITCLSREMEIMGSGDLDREITVRGNDELTYLAENLEEMRVALKHHTEEEARLREENNQIVSRLSHDIRTPLTSMMLYIDLIREGRYGSDEDRDRYIDKVYGSAERLAYLAEDLHRQVKGFPQIGEEECSIGGDEVTKVLDSAVENLGLFGFDVDYSSDCTVRGGEAVAVSSRNFARIVDNITSNIIRHGDRQETVNIAVEHREAEVLIVFENSAKAAASGYTKEGTGLGTVRRLVEAGGGRVEYTAGERFRVEIRFGAAGDESV
ncbi:MAG: HAMP domain-containing histidine kinase [Clostridiales bacterium]|nr:HAMP domain-containing histidine kinase [Clostridiales bacterium]MDD7035256.1 HAMP domain-containing sensor histidine kinase [Bacillota bacterium]MDY2921022.1 HAMP domain-containing sensor histidine kinase [Lentihominibacter sp.]